jgi:hypothetical protein
MSVAPEKPEILTADQQVQKNLQFMQDKSTIDKDSYLHFSVSKFYTKNHHAAWTWYRLIWVLVIINTIIIVITSIATGTSPLWGLVSTWAGYFVLRKCTSFFVARPDYLDTGSVFFTIAKHFYP